MPWWMTDGVVITTLLHIGPVEFLYYWLHRALHHHYLYSRYHSHQHSSIVTEPITSVIHPFGEHLAFLREVVTKEDTGAGGSVASSGVLPAVKKFGQRRQEELEGAKEQRVVNGDELYVIFFLHWALVPPRLPPLSCARNVLSMAVNLADVVSGCTGYECFGSCADDEMVGVVGLRKKMTK